MLASALIGLIAVVQDNDDREDPQRPGEIIVTGERTRRSLKDTPSSVVVVTARDLGAMPADRVDQVLSVVPNMQLGSGTSGPAIRGLDTTGALQALPAFLGGNRPRTTLVVDGRRTTYNEFVFGVTPVWDIDRIEVFRSPQTITQGQNSIAGAVFVYSQDPTFEPEYRGRAIVGNYRTGELSAAASGPLSSDVALRLSGDWRYSRTTSHITNRIENGDPNHDTYGLARAKLLVTPRGDPGGRIELIYSHTQSQAPQVVGLTPPFGKRRDENGFYGVFRVNVDALTATAHQPLAANLAVDAILTRGDSDTRRLAFHGLGQTHIQGSDWSAEAVVNWSPKWPLRAVAGVSGNHLALQQFIDLSLLGGLGRFHDAQDSLGVFGEATLTAVPRTTLSAGIRYQQDRQVRVGGLGTNVSDIPLNYDRTFRAWLPKLSLAYDFSTAVRAGVLVERASNPGGTTLRFDTGQPDNFEAEQLWDYEVFARAKFGSSLAVSANLFYYDMRDAQRAKDINILAPGGFEVGFADLFNVPRAHSYGAEAELDWHPNARLLGRVGLGLLRTRIAQSAADHPEFDRREFARSPHFTASAAIDWLAMPRLRVSAQMRYHSRYFSDDANSAAFTIDSSTIADAKAEYQLGRVSLFVGVRNLFDTLSMLVLRVPNPNTGKPTEGEANDPRMATIGVEARF